MLSIETVIKHFTAGPLICLLATPLVIKFAQKCNLLTDASKPSHPAHVHSGIIPRAGGAAIYLGLLMALVIFTPMDKKLAGIILGGLVIVIVGLLDDKYNLSPYIRLVAGLAAALFVVGSGIGVSYIYFFMAGKSFYHIWN